MIQKKHMLAPVSEENVSESELTENNESDVSNTISEEETADNYSLTMRKTILQFLPKKMTAPSEQDDNADDDTETDIEKEQRKLNLQKIKSQD